MSARYRDQQASDLERKNGRLRRELADKDRQSQKLAEPVSEQQKQSVDAEKQIVDLERQLALRKQNSTNSSKPPSADGLAGEPRERGRRKKSRWKAGGQPGHRGAHRPLVPGEKVEEMRPVLPERCRHCGHSLPAPSAPVRTTGEPQRHQVTERPHLLNLLGGFR